MPNISTRGQGTAVPFCKYKKREAIDAFYANLDSHTLQDVVTGSHRTRMGNLLLDLKYQIPPEK
ncbi:MAG: hypothetical protein NTV12_11115 [Verrucomicrobia bacterium]|nr:hypothetical protein [Verrucomicrobiota bacterium]